MNIAVECGTAGTNRRLVAHHQSAIERPRPELLAALRRYLAANAPNEVR